MDASAKNTKKIGLARLAKARSMSGGINNIGSDSTNPENTSSDGSIALNWSESEPSPAMQEDDRCINDGIPLSTPSSSDSINADNHSKISLSVTAADTHIRSEIPLSNTIADTYIRSEIPLSETVADTDNRSKIPLSDTVSIPSTGEGRMSEQSVESRAGVVQGEEVTPSPFKKSFFQSLHRRSSSRRPIHQLGLPKVAVRSRSLSRLSDAFSQVHNVCLLPTADAENQKLLIGAVSATNASTSSSTATEERNERSSVSFSMDVLNDGSSQEEDSSEEFDDSGSQESEDPLNNLATRRWSSLGQINSDRLAPMSTVRPSEARQKNYLFGGLGSLLGPTELERYFPDRKVTIFIATWNMNDKEPPTSLDDFLLPDDMETMPDLYVVGTQESGGERMEWEIRLQTTIGPSHVLFSSTVLGTLHLSVFLRRDLVWFCSVPEETYHSLRPGTYFKTKGAIAISFQFFGTKMLFVNTHLFAHEEKLSQRIQNYKNIVHNLDLPTNLPGNKLKRSKDVTHRYDIVFWMGDLNFRLVGNRDDILDHIDRAFDQTTNMQELLQYDQLSESKRKGEVFAGFDEGRIRFAPTFKFDVGTNDYDSSSKQRMPSYTDRILYKSTRDPIICTSYNSCPLFKTSDHKPVCGVYNFKVRPGKDDVPLAAGLFQRDVYLAALKRRRKFFHQPSSKNCQMQ